ncbi:MAG TPA: ATP-binding protein [Pyrinomonadaceae bacterium]|nr:ATP-binding protein [Pyrinomonadaceae bacterium]
MDDLLDVARISSNKLELRKERVSLAEIVNSAIETSRPLIERASHQLQLSLPEEPVTLDADPIRLAQAFSNLLNNAAKYSQPGSRISLTATQEDGELIVKIRDMGIGIDSDKLQRIFEMFVQVEPSRERADSGLGIGLTLVQRLIEMHDGSIEARSDGVGQGSEFVVRLPVAAPLPADTPAVKNDRAAPPNVRQRILVVDDNVDAVESMAMALELLGHEVATALDGVEAIQAAKLFRPDLVFLDIGMPRLNGYETARQIRQQPWGQLMVLVALTGWGQEEDRQRTLAAGFNYHVVKPIDFLRLGQLVEETANGKHRS